MSTSAAIQYRLATLDDAETVRELVESAFRAEDSREGWVGDMGLASSFRMGLGDVQSKITKPDSAILVAYTTTTTNITNNEEQHQQQVIVGCVGVAKLLPEGSSSDAPTVGRLSILAVDRRQHRLGLGRKILAQGEAYCVDAWRVDKLGLNALNTRKQLLAWYRRQGYEPNGETSPFPYEFFKDRELPDDLHFIEMYKDASPPAAAAASSSSSAVAAEGGSV